MVMDEGEQKVLRLESGVGCRRRSDDSTSGKTSERMKVSSRKVVMV